ncbi:MAG: hypothetical protein ACOC6C_05485 [Verrucomicrobiota bacterium]
MIAVTIFIHNDRDNDRDKDEEDQDRANRVWPAMAVLWSVYAGGV